MTFSRLSQTSLRDDLSSSVTKKHAKRAFEFHCVESKSNLCNRLNLTTPSRQQRWLPDDSSALSLSLSRLVVQPPAGSEDHKSTNKE